MFWFIVFDSFLCGYILCVKLKLNKTKKQKPQLKPKLAFGFESLQVRNYGEKAPFFLKYMLLEKVKLGHIDLLCFCA